MSSTPDGRLVPTLCWYIDGNSSGDVEAPESTNPNRNAPWRGAHLPPRVRSPRLQPELATLVNTSAGPVPRIRGLLADSRSGAPAPARLGSGNGQAGQVLE